MKKPDSSRSRLRRSVAAGAGVALVAGGAWSQLGVGADPVSSDIATTCSIATGSFAVSVPVTVDDTVDPIVEGGAQVVVLDTGLPELPVEATINRLVVTLPIPEQIASVDSVSFSGGNMTGTHAVSGSNLVLTFTGPQSSSAMDLPTVTSGQTVADGIGSSTISWLTFSEIVADTNYGTATCTPDDSGQVVNSTTVEAADEPTEPTEPTEPSEPPTTSTPAEPTPTTDPAPSEPTPTEPAPEDEDGSADVSASIDAQVEVDLPDGAPVLPGLPPAPALPSMPSLPPAGDLPQAPSVPPAPSLPPAPTLPAPPAMPAPTLPAPTLPEPPVIPTPTVPTPTVPPSPSPTPPAVPDLPLPLPDLPGLELDVDLMVEAGIGL